MVFSPALPFIPSKGRTLIAAEIDHGYWTAVCSHSCARQRAKIGDLFAFGDVASGSATSGNYCR
jgi:hypothetical protein